MSINDDGLPENTKPDRSNTRHLLSLLTARADRASTAEDQNRIEQALYSVGFGTWKKIELDGFPGRRRCTPFWRCDAPGAE
jgi:hypothetical protein